jgi:DNA-binding protein HU-beta
MSDILVNKQTLGDLISEKFVLPKGQGVKVMEFVIEQILEQLKLGNKVSLYGLCTLEVKQMAARMGINPKTKEKIQIPAKKKMACKVAKQVKDALK